MNHRNRQYIAVYKAIFGYRLDRNPEVLKKEVGDALFELFHVAKFPAMYLRNGWKANERWQTGCWRWWIRWPMHAIPGFRAFLSLLRSFAMCGGALLWRNKAFSRFPSGTRDAVRLLAVESGGSSRIYGKQIPVNDSLASARNTGHCILNLEFWLWPYCPKFSTSEPPSSAIKLLRQERSQKLYARISPLLKAGDRSGIWGIHAPYLHAFLRRRKWAAAVPRGHWSCSASSWASRRDSTLRSRRRSPFAASGRPDRDLSLKSESSFLNLRNQTYVPCRRRQLKDPSRHVHFIWTCRESNTIFSVTFVVKYCENMG